MATSSDYAKLSKAAYYSDDRALSMAREVDPDFHLDTELSNVHMKTFHNPNLNKTVVSFRGTKLNDASDHLTNTLTFFNAGHHSSRFKNGSAAVKKAVQKYGKNNVSCTGHSQGGAVCSDVSKTEDIPAVTFNKAKTLIPTKKAPKETSYKTITDPLSAGSTFKLPKKINGHSIDNYT